MRVMGLDVGSKTVGVAISDELGLTAQGIETIPINEEEQLFGLDRIEELINDWDVGKIVVGFPKKRHKHLRKN